MDSTCKTCHFYEDNHCRRYPPQLTDNIHTKLPIVGQQDWCGEWKPNEEQLQKEVDKVWENYFEHIKRVDNG